MSIIASQSGEFNIEKGKEVMEALLAKHADSVTAVYAHNDDMALGAISALKEAGKLGFTQALTPRLRAKPGAISVRELAAVGDLFELFPSNKSPDARAVGM
mgnify:CR=1 FL=1